MCRQLFRSIILVTVSLYPALAMSPAGGAVPPPPRDIEEVRYSLEGEVEEFLERREGGERKAFLTVAVTLLDLSSKESAGLVVFQNTYRLESPIPEKGGAGFAAGMSRAMSQFSRQVISDIGSALRGR